MIPLLRPSVTQAEIDAVVETLKSGWWGLGPKTAQFEKEFAAYIGVKHAIALNSATAALHLALEAMDLPAGEVIVPPITFVSTAWAVIYAGHKPVFADVDEKTLNISSESIEKAITPQTRAIIPVHYSGRPVDLAAIEHFGLPVIEDCAHACGARYGGKPVGSRNIGCFSFHAVKNLATGDGGMITTNDSALAQKLVPLRWVGIDKSTWVRAERHYGWDYHVISKGYKVHMNDLAASLGLAQLRRLDEMNRRRREIADIYRQELSNLDWLQLPEPSDETRESSWHCFAVRLERRDDFIKWLLDHEISAGVHYRPTYHHPAFKEFADPADFPVAEREWQRLATIPLFSALTDSELDHIIATIRKFPVREGLKECARATV